MVEARFKLFEGEQKAILWDMVKVGDVWQVDNIEAEGLNLRVVLDEQLGARAAARAEAGDAAVQCMTFVRLESDALAKAKGDVTALEQAFSAWKTKAEAEFTADELAQFFASNIAVMDDTPPADIKAKADACVAQVPAPISTP